MKAAAWIGMAILIVLTIATMAALTILAIPDMCRDLRAHWRKGRKLARDHAPDRPGEPDQLDALINAVVCARCRPGGSGWCICDRKCAAPLCPAPDTAVFGLTAADQLWLRQLSIKGDE